MNGIFDKNYETFVIKIICGGPGATEKDIEYCGMYRKKIYEMATKNNIIFRKFLHKIFYHDIEMYRDLEVYDNAPKYVNHLYKSTETPRDDIVDIYTPYDRYYYILCTRNHGYKTNDKAFNGVFKRLRQCIRNGTELPDELEMVEINLIPIE